jgi:hypothetical protein
MHTRNPSILTASTFARAWPLALAGAAAIAGCAAESAPSDDALAIGARPAALPVPPVPVPGTTNPPVLGACGIGPMDPPGEFDFESGGVDGWQTAGLFDGDSNNIVLNESAGVALPFFSDPNNAPDAVGTDPIDGRGSVCMLTAGMGIPAQTTSPYWRQDLISPDLSGNPGWQGRDITFWILDRITSFDAPQPLAAQLVLAVTKCDGTPALLRAVDGNGNPVFCSAAHGQWIRCAAHIDRTGVAAIQHVQIRVFGRSGFLYEGGLYVDDVQACPASAATVCGGACTNLAGDPNNCGSCGHTCGAGQICSSATCVACAVGEAACGSVCANLKTDPDNCGQCGNACGDGSVCRLGVCHVPGCPGKYCF